MLGLESELLLTECKNPFDRGSDPATGKCMCDRYGLLMEETVDSFIEHVKYKLYDEYMVNTDEEDENEIQSF